MEGVELFSFLINLFLNVLQLIAVFISVFTFLFFMFNKYSKALRYILAPCGLGVWSRIRVLFMCRNSVVKKRAFLEFAILKSQGHLTNSSSWRTIINEFKSFYFPDKTKLVYAIPNCTALIGADFSDAVSRYFEFMSLKKVRKAFGIQDERIGWVIKIRIEEAYATPTCLLTGLLSQYEENWTEFIKRYVSTAYMTEAEDRAFNDILSSELYLTFAWLLWGPSYELNFQNYWAGLCQLSYGDESNSIPAVADSGSHVIEQLKEKFMENKEGQYGTLLSVDVSLYEKKSYYRVMRDFIKPDSLYFCEKIEKGELSFATQIDEFTPSTNYKSKKYYCTAYVWLLFELEDDDFAFNPEKSVAFFEHANLTDKHTYNFLIGTLIDKCLKHFKDIFSNPELNGRKYRFVCALNAGIENECRERFSEIAKQENDFGKAVRERIIMQPKRASTAVFDAIDEFFSRNTVLSYEKVDYREKNMINDLGQFYTDIYMECFPNEDERETFDHILSYLKKGESSKDYKHHILLAKNENNQVVGGCIFDYYKKSNSGVIEFIAVKSDLQSGGIGSMIYKRAIAILEEDSYRAGKKGLSCVFSEIDAPENNLYNIKKYLYFWNKNGYKRLNFQYVQPALSSAQSPVYGLWFTVMPLRLQGENISNETILSVLHDYLKYAMGIERPEANKEFKRMKEEIEAKEHIALLNILDN